MKSNAITIGATPPARNGPWYLLCRDVRDEVRGRETLPAQGLMDTAGLRGSRDLTHSIGQVDSVSSRAQVIPMRLFPMLEKVAESAQLPQPSNTDYAVLMNSAARRLAIGTFTSLPPSPIYWK
jgi:hypothetical protein